jgi:hypothetical protein
MIPVYTYRHATHDWELIQDGFVLGYMRRTNDLHHSYWLASPDGEQWKAPFKDRKSAREWLQSI